MKKKVKTHRNMTCKARVKPHFDERLADLKKLLEAERNGEEDTDNGNLSEYGLCFDYVTPETFRDQKEAYFRYQLSWGGPSDEFRFYVNPDFSCHRIEYWFLDWFDGAHIVLTDDTESLLTEIWQWFSDGMDLAALVREAAL
jgi:hypothetical protein